MNRYLSVLNVWVVNSSFFVAYHLARRIRQESRLLIEVKGSFVLDRKRCYENRFYLILRHERYVEKRKVVVSAAPSGTMGPIESY
jgi:hypothetical protein